MKEKRYCAFCKNPITVYKKKHIAFSDFFYALVLSLLLSYSIWQSMDARLLVFLVGILFVAELFILLRWRIFVKCNHCGFDPILYKKDPEKVVTSVRARMEQRMKEEFFQFSPYKFDKLARRKVEKAKATSEASKLPLKNSPKTPELKL